MDVMGRLDATGLAALVRSGEVSPEDLVEAAMGRIEKLDPSLNAVIHRSFETALDLARSADLPDGPFRGVPFLLKDLWPTSAGDPFHCGVAGMKAAGYRHPTDANLVTRYRQAGLVLVGRTNTPELGLVATTEPLAYGPTHNPWDPSRGPGGSSGGAAAAVAAGMVPAANASDGGGSIRIPAAMCGLVGLKPSRGRVSMGPMQDEWGLSVQHVVCHTVRDCAGLLDVSAIPFPGDGVLAPAPQRPFAAEVGAPAGRLRIGLLDHALHGDTHAECSAAARAAGTLLAELGHHVEEDHPTALRVGPELVDAFTNQWAVNCRANLVALGGLLGRDLVAEDVERGTWLLAEMATHVDALTLARGAALQARFRRETAAWWADGHDLLVTPTTAAPAPRLGDLASTDEDPLRGLSGSAPYATFTSPFNVTGQPAVSLPLSRAADGMPLGVQLVASYGREDLLLRVAAQLEEAVRWSDQRAPLHP
jgi:amidase